MGNRRRLAHRPHGDEEGISRRLGADLGPRRPTRLHPKLRDLRGAAGWFAPPPYDVAQWSLPAAEVVAERTTDRDAPDRQGRLLDPRTRPPLASRPGRDGRLAGRAALVAGQHPARLERGRRRRGESLRRSGRRHLRSAGDHDGHRARLALSSRAGMGFFLGLILFVGLLGWLDTKIPWSRGTSA